MGGAAGGAHGRRRSMSGCRLWKRASRSFCTNKDCGKDRAPDRLPYVFVPWKRSLTEKARDASFEERAASSSLPLEIVGDGTGDGLSGMLLVVAEGGAGVDLEAVDFPLGGDLQI